MLQIQLICSKNRFHQNTTKKIKKIYCWTQCSTFLQYKST